MNNKIRIIICAAAITLTVSLFSGCGSTKTDSANTLVIWSEFSSNEHKAIEQIANEWAKEKGCNVKVIETTNGLDSYITAVRSGGGPDLNIGVSQDEILYIYITYYFLGNNKLCNFILEEMNLL